jgi:hypothetical protein
MLGLSAAQGRSCGVALGRGVCGRCRGYLPREKPRCYGEVSLAANRSSSLSPVFPLHSLQAQPSCRPQAFPAGAALSHQRRCASISGFSPPFLSSLSLRSFGSGKGPDATRGAGGRLAAAQGKVWGRSGGPGGLGGFLGGGTGERYRQAKPGAQEFSGGRRLGRVGSLGDKAAKAAGRKRGPKEGIGPREGSGCIGGGHGLEKGAWGGQGGDDGGPDRFVALRLLFAGGRGRRPHGDFGEERVAPTPCDDALPVPGVPVPLLAPCTESQARGSLLGRLAKEKILSRTEQPKERGDRGFGAGWEKEGWALGGKQSRVSSGRVGSGGSGKAVRLAGSAAGDFRGRQGEGREGGDRSDCRCERVDKVLMFSFLRNNPPIGESCEGRSSNAGGPAISRTDRE